MDDGARGIIFYDSPVTFDCKCCGACCASGLEIYLNTVDMLKLRAYFKTPTDTLIGKYLRLELRAEYGSYPLCLINMPEGKCPFLEERLCSAHPARPAGCRLFPVIHYYGAAKGDTFADAPGMDFCPGGRDASSRPLRDWLALNEFENYAKAMEIQRRLAPLSRLRVSSEVSAALFRALFDFDSAPDFPLAGIFDAGREARALQWVEMKLDEILGGVLPAQ